jgi:hypothetical protein
MAKATKPEQKDYTIHFKVFREVTVDIKADSFSDAIEHAKIMDGQDVMDLPGELLDETIEITAIFEG